MADTCRLSEEECIQGYAHAQQAFAGYQPRAKENAYFFSLGNPGFVLLLCEISPQRVWRELANTDLEPIAPPLTLLNLLNLLI
jgi:hypothetical protein